MLEAQLADQKKAAESSAEANAAKLAELEAKLAEHQKAADAASDAASDQARLHMMSRADM